MSEIIPKIPIALVDILKDFTKTILRDNPDNINLFAYQYFENRILERDGSLNKGYEIFQKSDKYFSNHTEKYIICKKQISQLVPLSSNKLLNTYTGSNKTKVPDHVIKGKTNAEASHQYKILKIYPDIELNGNVSQAKYDGIPGCFNINKSQHNNLTTIKNHFKNSTNQFDCKIKISKVFENLHNTISNKNISNRTFILLEKVEMERWNYYKKLEYIPDNIKQQSAEVHIGKDFTIIDTKNTNYSVNAMQCVKYNQNNVFGKSNLTNGITVFPKHQNLPQQPSMKYKNVIENNADINTNIVNITQFEKTEIDYLSENLLNCDRHIQIILNVINSISNINKRNLLSNRNKNLTLLTVLQKNGIILSSKGKWLTVLCYVESRSDYSSNKNSNFFESSKKLQDLPLNQAIETKHLLIKLKYQNKNTIEQYGNNKRTKSSTNESTPSVYTKKKTTTANSKKGSHNLVNIVDHNQSSNENNQYYYILLADQNEIVTFLLNLSQSKENFDEKYMWDNRIEKSLFRKISIGWTHFIYNSVNNSKHLMTVDEIQIVLPNKICKMSIVVQKSEVMAKCLCLYQKLNIEFTTFLIVNQYSTVKSVLDLRKSYILSNFVNMNLINLVCSGDGNISDISEIISKYTIKEKNVLKPNQSKNFTDRNFVLNVIHYYHSNAKQKIIKKNCVVLEKYQDLLQNKFVENNHLLTVNLYHIIATTWFLEDAKENVYIGFISNLLKRQSGDSNNSTITIFMKKINNIFKITARGSHIHNEDNEIGYKTHKKYFFYYISNEFRKFLSNKTIKNDNFLAANLDENLLSLFNFEHPKNIVVIYENLNEKIADENIASIMKNSDTNQKFKHQPCKNTAATNSNTT